MPLVRGIILLLLLGAVASFVAYIATGQVRYRTWGLKVITWTMIAAFGFFAVLILERVA